MNGSETIFEYIPPPNATIPRRRLDPKLYINVLSGMITLCFGLFILAFIYSSPLGIITAIIFCVVAASLHKGMSTADSENYELCIIAYPESIQLGVIDHTSSEIVEEIELEYAEIQFGYFTNKDCTDYIIMLTDGENIHLHFEKYSWQQYFFLYIASDYFNLRSPAPWKIIKKFGTQKQYENILLKRGEKA